MSDSLRNWVGAIGERLRRVIRRHVAEQIDERSQEWESISDITQDALAAATQRFEDFRGTTEAEFVAWICTIADRKLADRRRASRRLRRDVRRNRNLGDVIASLADPSSRPDEELRREEDRQWAHSLIDRLPMRHRTAVRARYFDEQSISEIARRLDCSENAAKGLLKRGLRQLRCIAQDARLPTITYSASPRVVEQH